jgi:hypothetical protein
MRPIYVTLHLISAAGVNLYVAAAHVLLVLGCCCILSILRCCKAHQGYAS